MRTVTQRTAVLALTKDPSKILQSHQSNKQSIFIEIGNRLPSLYPPILQGIRPPIDRKVDLLLPPSGMIDFPSVVRVRQETVLVQYLGSVPISQRIAKTAEDMRPITIFKRGVSHLEPSKGISLYA